ncbi:MAG: vancomycin resistance histidine kinase VanS, partial [Acetatifactor sp.]
MNNKKQKIGDEFKHLQTKLFIKTAVIMFASVLGIFVLYYFVLKGHLANFVVGFLNLFIMDYRVALNIYQQVVRNYMDFYVLLAIVIVFLIVLR